MGSYLPSTRRARIKHIFFILQALQKAFQKPFAGAKGALKMKLGQQLRVLISKRGRALLDTKGNKWEIFEQLEETISTITGQAIEIVHEDSSIFNLYVDDETTLWVGDGLTAYELYILECELERLVSPKGYKVQLVEASEEERETPSFWSGEDLPF